MIYAAIIFCGIALTVLGWLARFMAAARTGGDGIDDAGPDDLRLALKKGIDAVVSDYVDLIDFHSVDRKFDREGWRLTCHVGVHDGKPVDFMIKDVLGPVFPARITIQKIEGRVADKVIIKGDLKDYPKTEKALARARDRFHENPNWTPGSK